MLDVEVAVRIRPPSYDSVRSTVPIRGQWGKFVVDCVVEESGVNEDIFTQTVVPQVNTFLQVCVPCTWKHLQITQACKHSHE